MHNLQLAVPVERAHKRIVNVRRQHAGGIITDKHPVAPPGFTLTRVTLTETLPLPRTTIITTEVVTMAVPITPKAPVAPTTTGLPPTPTIISKSAIPTTTSSSVTPAEPPPTQSPPPPPPPPPPPAPPKVAPTTTSTVVVAPSSSSDPSNVGATSKGLSGGALGGVIAIAVIAALLALVFVVRKIFLRRRQQKRATWGGNIYPKTDFAPTFNEKAGASDIPAPPEKGDFGGPRPINSAMSPYPLPPPPPMSYNNLPPPSPTSASRMMSPPVPMIQTPVPTLQPALGSPAVTLTPAPAEASAAKPVSYAYVRCTFVPTLPDELSITTGELVRVLGEFDDGWALCGNSRGEQGVVPLECLERNQLRPNVTGYMGEGTGDWRMSRRASSLYAASPQGATANAMRA